MKIILFSVFVLLSITNVFAITINPPKGRLAIIADGNSPDPDDITATPLTLALLKATGYNERLVHYSHSCDLIRGKRISKEAEKERHHLMQLACDMTARRWGGYDGLTFFDAQWQMQETIDDLTKVINMSSEDDPLWIIEAGEPDIIVLDLKSAVPSKLKYVKIITHHRANDDSGDFFTWNQLLSYGVEEFRITDQNINLKLPLNNWIWARDSNDPRIKLLWNFNAIMENDDVVKFQKGYFDCSDAGMLLYWLTGAKNNGSMNVNENEIRSILMKYIQGKK